MFISGQRPCRPRRWRNWDSEKRLFNLRQNLFHLVAAKRAQGLAFDVTERTYLKDERAHGLIIRRLHNDDPVVSAHCPVFLNNFHSHLLRLRHGGGAAFHCVLDVANPLVFKLNQTDITWHSVLLLFEVVYCKRNASLWLRKKERRLIYASCEDRNNTLNNGTGRSAWYCCADCRRTGRFRRSGRRLSPRSRSRMVGYRQTALANSI